MASHSEFRAEREAKREIETLLSELLDTLGLDRPVDPEKLCQRLGQHLGRPVQVQGTRLPTAHASGAAFRVSEPSDAYIVVYQAATSAGHQAHVIFHELMHIVLGHMDQIDGSGSEISCRWASDADAGTVDSGFGLEVTAELREWEAEIGATILSEWSRSDPSRQMQASGDETARRFASAFMGTPWT